MITIKPLIWTAFDSQFARSWISETSSIGSKYCIWIELNSGKTKVAGLDRQHHYFNSIDEAKDWCQKDFEKIINEFLQ